MYLHRSAHNFKRRQKNLILMPKHAILIVKNKARGGMFQRDIPKKAARFVIRMDCSDLRAQCCG